VNERTKERVSELASERVMEWVSERVRWLRENGISRERIERERYGNSTKGGGMEKAGIFRGKEGPKVHRKREKEWIWDEIGTFWKKKFFLGPQVATHCAPFAIAELRFAWRPSCRCCACIKLRGDKDPLKSLPREKKKKKIQKNQ